MTRRWQRRTTTSRALFVLQKAYDKIELSRKKYRQRWSPMKKKTMRPAAELSGLCFTGPRGREKPIAQRSLIRLELFRRSRADTQKQKFGEL
jgi:hypothetical protein